MLSNDPFAAAALHGGEPDLSTPTGPVAFWNVFLGEVRDDLDEHGAALAHRRRVLDVLRDEGLLGLVRPDLTGEWFGRVSGTFAIDEEHRALLAGPDGPVAGPRIQALSRRLGDRLDATVDIFVAGMTEPWHAARRGADPIAAFERRLASMELAPADFVICTLRATPRAARAFERAIERFGIAHATPSQHRFLRYDGEVDLATMITARPVLTIAVADDRVEVMLYAKWFLPTRRPTRPLWGMVWIAPGIGIHVASAVSGPGTRGCLDEQRRARVRPATPLDPGIARGLGLDDDGASALQALLDDETPAIDTARIVTALGLPGDLAVAMQAAMSEHSRRSGAE